MKALLVEKNETEAHIGKNMLNWFCRLKKKRAVLSHVFLEKCGICYRKHCHFTEMETTHLIHFYRIFKRWFQATLRGPELVNCSPAGFHISQRAQQELKKESLIRSGKDGS